jgi:hypothetical protein
VEDPTSDPEEPSGKVNLEFVTATTEVNYLRAEDRILGKGLSLQGHSQLIVDGAGSHAFPRQMEPQFASHPLARAIRRLPAPTSRLPKEFSLSLTRSADRREKRPTRSAASPGQLPTTTRMEGSCNAGTFPGDQLQFYYAGPTPNKLSPSIAITRNKKSTTFTPATRLPSRRLGRPELVL